MTRETKNSIQFRDLQKEDKIKLFEIYSDKEAMKFRGSRPMENTEDALTFIKNQKFRSGSKYTIRKGIILMNQEELIGSSMFRFDTAQIDRCEIGYSIGRKYWGKGLGKEIVKAILQILTEYKKINEVIAWTNTKNIASIKILVFNGFHLVKQQGKPDAFLYKKRIVS